MFLLHTQSLLKSRLQKILWSSVGQYRARELAQIFFEQAWNIIHQASSEIRILTYLKENWVLHYETRVYISYQIGIYHCRRLQPNAGCSYERQGLEKHPHFLYLQKNTLYIDKMRNITSELQLARSQCQIWLQNLIKNLKFLPSSNKKWQHLITSQGTFKNGNFAFCCAITDSNCTPKSFVFGKDSLVTAISIKSIIVLKFCDTFGLAGNLGVCGGCILILIYWQIRILKIYLVLFCQAVSLSPNHTINR